MFLSSLSFSTGEESPSYFSADLILNLFPFETAIYNKHGIPNRFVGHPLADKIPVQNNTRVARAELKLADDKTIIALLPGSRLNEIKRIAGPILQAAEITQSKNHNLIFICGLVNEKSKIEFQRIKNEVAPDLDVNISIGNTHRIMEAADVIMLASGTATLEAMLYKKPMIVAYRLSFLTHLIVKLLAKIPYASLPNILAGKLLVPECLQSRCTAEILSCELNALLNSDEHMQNMKNQFTVLSTQLRRNADLQAANAILELVDGDKFD